MKIIIHNGKALKIYASEERAMRIVARLGVSRRSEFSEGRGRYKSFILPSSRRLSDLGLVEIWKGAANTARARRFFAGEGKRCNSAIFANTRRLNALLTKLENTGENSK